ncbi:Succinyl-CoA:(R)-benzylsuccinate CoA-transferase subunit BbsE [compost metagenome]
MRAGGILRAVGNGEGGQLELPGLPFTLASMKSGDMPAVPRLGQHTAEVLAELGYDAAQIDDLVCAGAIGCEPQEAA